MNSTGAFPNKARPTNEAQFVEFMKEANTFLHEKDVKLFQRPGRMHRLIWEAFRDSTSISPNQTYDVAGEYEGNNLVEKSSKWYISMYGNKMKPENFYGYAPVEIAGAIFRVKTSMFVGTINFTIEPNITSRVQGGFNILSEVEDLTEELARTLTWAELKNYQSFYEWMSPTLQWLINLPQGDEFTMARWDYAASTSELLAGRYNQSAWASEQAAEKIMKGLLKSGGSTYPKGGKQGHDLLHIGQLLKKHNVDLNLTDLRLASCSPNVRYNEEQRSQEQALLANHAALRIMDSLRKDPNAVALLK